jgi:hypothetical protein
MAKKKISTENKIVEKKKSGMIVTLAIMLFASGIYISTSIIMGLFSSAYNKMGFFSVIALLLVIIGYVTSIVGFTNGKSWSKLLSLITSIIVLAYMIIDFFLSYNGFAILIGIANIIVALYLLLSNNIKEAFN